MSDNGKLLASLHKHLGDNMKFTLNVGLTHWANARLQKGIITERNTFFFVPSQAQKRIKQWGMAVCNGQIAPNEGLIVEMK